MEHQKLFDHMINEHGLTLMDNELKEIILIAQNDELLRETAMRCQIAFPANEQDEKWFDLALADSDNFIDRLFDRLDLINNH